MKRLLLLAILFFSCENLEEKREVRKHRPNIIYILTDDLGTGDVSAYNKNGKINTKNIDALAKDSAGVTFTNAHSPSAVCTPTRYSIITGKYNWRRLNSGVSWGSSSPLISNDTYTVANFFKKHGYSSACIGKWHLGLKWQFKTRKSRKPEDIDFSKKLLATPNNLGFDYYYGVPASLDMAPYVYIENNRVLEKPENIIYNDIKNVYRRKVFMRKGPMAKNFVIEETMKNFTDKTINYIKSVKGSDNPFFIYLAYGSPHTPIVPRKEFEGKSKLSHYGDFVIEQDHELGRLVDFLKENNLYDDTVIVFTSDNGASPQAKFNKLVKKGHNPSNIYRGFKAGLYEGGHRVPFIIKWHKSSSLKIKKKTYDNPVLISDFLGTFQDYFSDKEYKKHDSKSFLPIIKGKGVEREYVVSHSFSGEFAIQDKRWKLIISKDSAGWSHNYDINTYERLTRKQLMDLKKIKLPSIQLYDLKEDIGERKNLYGQYPKVVGRLKKALISIINKQTNHQSTINKLNKLKEKLLQ